jgi:hypothetical protein
LRGMRITEDGTDAAVTVDPDRPVYVVSVFEPRGEGRAHCVHAWQLVDVDVAEVLAWAVDKASGWPWMVQVAAADFDDPHLVRLAGDDPTRGTAYSAPYVLAPDVVPSMSDVIGRVRNEGQ